MNYRDMKILFINVQLRPDSKRRQLPVGLAYVMTAVKNAGYEFDFIDMDIDKLTLDDLRNRLEGNYYTYYLLGAIVTAYKIVRDIVQVIRDSNYYARIIVGNSVATSIPDTLLENTETNFAVLGEGDITTVNLLKVLEDNYTNIFSVNGVAIGNYRILAPVGYETLKRNVIKDINTIEFPDWSLFDLEKYKFYSTINTNENQDSNLISFPLSSARGCPYNCSFCYHVFKGEKYRKCSDTYIMKEISRLYYEFGANFISFWDELTFANISSVKRRIKKFLTLDFSVLWEAPIRGDLVTKADLSIFKDLKDVGCSSLAFSLENASQEILKAINKKLSISQVIEQSEVLWRSGITPLTSVIFGYPQETPDTIKLTLDVCRQCNIYPSVGYLLPLPKTKIYKWAVKNGYIDNEHDYLMRIGDRQDLHINLTQMEDNEFIELVESGLEELANNLGLKLDSFIKTTTYQKPKNIYDEV